MEPTRNAREPRVVISAWSAITVTALLLAPLDAGAQSPCNDDGVCDPGETICECPDDDCPDVCGDGCCTGAEDEAGCPEDCEAAGGDPCDPDSGAPVYFEETFGRERGTPVTEVRDFDGELVDGTVCLEVSRVASATLDLNDERVFRQSDFNNNVTELSRAVSVEETNSLVVRLTGRPTGTMHVRVVEGVAETPDGGMADGAMDGNADGGEATGGAGCSVGGSTPASPAAWLFLVFAALLVRRRA